MTEFAKSVILYFITSMDADIFDFFFAGIRSTVVWMRITVLLRQKGAERTFCHFMLFIIGCTEKCSENDHQYV